MIPALWPPPARAFSPYACLRSSLQTLAFSPSLLIYLLTIYFIFATLTCISSVPLAARHITMFVIDNYYLVPSALVIWTISSQCDFITNYIVIVRNKMRGSFSSLIEA